MPVIDLGKKWGLKLGGGVGWKEQYAIFQVMEVTGTARVTLDGKITKYPSGTMVHIPFGTAHRIENRGKEPLVFVEVQTGSCFGEDDIVRLEDDYGRRSLESISAKSWRGRYGR
ncbi:MAG: cupin domain-containing protein [Pseudomonadota bacterium]